jgi:hypothetical protein
VIFFSQTIVSLSKEQSFPNQAHYSYQHWQQRDL